MTPLISLPAKTRTILGKKVKTLRNAGLLPGVLYGHGKATQSLSVEYNTFAKVYKTAGESSLVDLSIDKNAPIKVLINDIARNPKTYRISHVDFYEIEMTKKLTTTIPLKFVGEAPAVKELGGVFVKTIDELEIECLPGDLVPEIKVDISSLKTFDDMIHISDLLLPQGLTLLSKTNEVVAKVMPPRSEEELKSLEEKVDEVVDTVKVIGKEKKVEEEEEKKAEEKQ